MSCNTNNDLTNNSTGELKIGGTLKITLSTAYSYDYILTNQYNTFIDSQHISSFTFTSLINEPTSYNGNLYLINLGSGSDYVNETRPVNLQCWLPNPIQIGKEYCFKSNVGAQFRFGLKSDYSDSETITVKLSAFKCPGRITGVEIKYDKAGKMLLKGEFDFISHLN